MDDEAALLSSKMLHLGRMDYETRAKPRPPGPAVLRPFLSPHTYSFPCPKGYKVYMNMAYKDTASFLRQREGWVA